MVLNIIIATRKAQFSVWVSRLHTFDHYIIQTMLAFQNFAMTDQAFQSTLAAGPKTLSAMESLVPVPSLSIWVDLVLVLAQHLFPAYPMGLQLKHT